MRRPKSFSAGVFMNEIRIASSLAECTAGTQTAGPAIFYYGHGDSGQAIRFAPAEVRLTPGDIAPCMHLIQEVQRAGGAPYAARLLPSRPAQASPERWPGYG